MNTMIRLAILSILALQFGHAAVAKPHSKPLKKVKTTSANTKIKGEAKPDMEARALVRRMAPFLVEEKTRGEIIQINKDGTFSKAIDGRSHEIEGHWKVVSGHLRLKWTSGEEQSYAVTFSGRTPLLVGQKARSKGHYVLNTED